MPIRMGKRIHQLGFETNELDKALNLFFERNS
jgi:hypothetical protein